MKKKTLQFTFFLLGILSIMNVADAQVRRSSFKVNNPAAIQGYKITSEISTTGTSPWGTDINGTWENIPVAFDPTNLDGCVAFPANYFTGKFALINRGGCEFGQKALNAQNAGATGVIIVNNLSLIFICILLNIILYTYGQNVAVFFNRVVASIPQMQLE